MARFTRYPDRTRPPRRTSPTTLCLSAAYQPVVGSIHAARLCGRSRPYSVFELAGDRATKGGRPTDCHRRCNGISARDCTPEARAEAARPTVRENRKRYYIVSVALRRFERGMSHPVCAIAR
jgi:hypothetical protein